MLQRDSATGGVSVRLFVTR